MENEVRTERYDLSNYPELAISQVYRMRAMIAAGAEEARQDLELRRRYLSGDLHDPILESVIGSEVAGAPPLGQGQEDQVHRREGHRDLLDSGLTQFLGRRLEVNHRDGRLRSLNNPEPMTNLGPELGNATMRGDQIWVETLGPRAEGQARMHDSRNRE